MERMKGLIVGQLKLACSRSQTGTQTATRLSMNSELKALIVDESPIRAAIIEDGLREAGFTRVQRLDTTDRLIARIGEIDPDIVVIDLANPQRDTLEQMFLVSRLVKRPVTMFVDQSDSDQTRAAIEAGVSAYVVDGLRRDRVKTIVEMCVTRFRAYERLETELHAARNALEDRKTIDRAKAILMKAKGLSEEEAYGLLRTTAMNKKRRIAQIAQSVITAAELLG
jgi:response regulator NasT